MSQRFLRCVHCGLPHAVDETVCPITGRPVERRARAAPPPSQRNPQPYASPSYAPPSYSPPAPERASSGRERVADRASEKLRAAPFAELDAQPHPLIGQVLGGKYRAIRVLGEGGMGTVYECEHVAIHRRVAVKVLNAAQARKKASLARFQNEAHVAGAIGHPNICEIYDMGELDDNSPFLVMELLTGETLADRIASEGALPFDDIVDIISQVLSGLVAAHEKSVIHRDIKPENVFLTQRPGLPPMIKLLDFGISKMGGGEELHLTRTGMVMGTPYYMSPEQARGDRKLDHRVDIYATGVMTYECLTGRRPFIAANYNALLVQILTGSPRPLHDLRPAVSDGFADFVSKAMHRDRNHRFQDAAEMQRELVNLRDPANARRIASVPPEPVPLVRNKRSPDDSAPKPPKPLAPQIPSPPKLPSDELASISVDIDTNLLDSGLGKPESAISEQTAESTSVEIPVHVDAPAPRSPREVTAQERASVLAAARASALPPAPASPPRPIIPAPPPIPAAAHRPSTPLMPGPLMPGPHRPTPMPGMAPVGSRELQRPPAREPPPIPRHSPGVPLTARSAGAPAAKPLAARPLPRPSIEKAPLAPTVGPAPRTEADPNKARVVRRDKPERRLAYTPTDLDVDVEDPDDDPTEVGVIPHTGMHGGSDAPIDADSTERIPPERLARMHAKLAAGAPRPSAPPGGVRETRNVSPTDRRAEHEDSDPDGDAPTTLFDRRALKMGKPSRKNAPTPAGTRASRAGPVPSKGDPTVPGMPPVHHRDGPKR